MTIQEFLGWAMSIVNSLGLADAVKVFFVVVLAAGVIKYFVGLRQ